LPEIVRPLVVDASSNILSRRIDFNNVSVVYSGAQKNIGAAGLTLVIVDQELVGEAHPLCPTAFNWKTVAEHESMYNTPPTYGIYMAGMVLKWLKRQEA
jgi:phosphoserine aminotransferase